MTDAPFAGGTLSTAEDIGAATAEWGGKVVATHVAKEVAGQVDGAAAEASVFWMGAALHGDLRFETFPASDEAVDCLAGRPKRATTFDQAGSGLLRPWPELKPWLRMTRSRWN